MSESYEKMTVLELRRVAKEKGVKLGAGISKQGIIDKLMEKDSVSAPQDTPVPTAPAHPVRSASIIADDEDDGDDVPVLTPNPSVQLAPRKPAPRPAPAPGSTSSLSSISSKAPAFTTEGSRAWHNPMAYQTQPTYQNRSSWNNPSSARPAPYGSTDRYGQDNRSQAQSRYQPKPQASAPDAQSRYGTRPQAPYQTPGRFGPEQPVQDARTDAAPQPEQPAYREYVPQPEFVPPTAPEYGRRDAAPMGRDAGAPAPATPDALMTGDCGDGAGVLELHPEGYGFLRADNFLPGKNDVYVSNAQIRRFALRSGDHVAGKTRPQHPGSRYSALLYITEINGLPPEEMPARASFDQLTAIYPKRRIALSQGGEDVLLRGIDLCCPIGFGQRALIHVPPKAGRTTLVKKLAAAIRRSHPGAHLMTLLIDERPEDVVDMKESFPGDVLYSTFDAPAENHVRVSELTLERAQRLVEQKKDVVLFVDSLTRLCRACNALAPQTARSLPSGLAMGALHKPKKLFGAARNTREGGSLTVVAILQTGTGNPLDDCVADEFRNTANMELFLERIPGEKRMLPCADFGRSATRHDELMLSPAELALAARIREKLQDTPVRSALKVIPWLQGDGSPDAIQANLEKE